MSVNVVVISLKDNVAVATRYIKEGEKIEGAEGGLVARADIPYAHKVALDEIPSGGKVIKYGESIGLAAEDIRPGDYVHVHNLKAEDS